MDVEKLKQKILDLAIRGKLVPQDPNDEPASVLIEKIRAEKEKLVKEGKIKASKEESYIYKGSDNFYYEKTPNNWSIVSLGELISLKSGVDLKLNEINTNQMGIPYLTGASCFNNGNLDIIRWTKFPTNITHKGDLLITVKGTIGEMAFNNIGDAHIARQIMSISISPYINPFYVFYVLEARKNELIQKSSSLIPGITRDNVLLFQIAVPPRNEQDKIVEALKTSLDKIQVIKENIEEISNLLALIKSQILSSVFAERSSYKSYYGSRTFTTLNKLIPSDKIGDGDWVLSENMDENGEYRIVQLKHIGKGCYVNKPYKRINKNFFENNSCSEIKPNFLLINRLVSEEMDVCLLPSFSYKTITSVDVCWIAPDEKYDQKYLMYYLLSPAFQSQVLLKSSGSTRKRISKKNLISIPLQIHSLDDQKMIVKDIEQYFELLNSIIQ